MKTKDKLQLYKTGDRVRGKGVMAGEMGSVHLVELFVCDDNMRPIIVEWDDKRYGKAHVNAEEIEFVGKASPQRAQRSQRKR